jgi:hypothetical protein
MGKISILIQGVLVYIIFIIGIAIISEHICRRAHFLKAKYSNTVVTPVEKFTDYYNDDSLDDDLLKKVNAKLNESSPGKVLAGHTDSLVTLGNSYSAINEDDTGINLGLFSKVEATGKKSLASDFFEITKQKTVEVDSKYIFNVPAFDPKASLFATL